MILLAAQQIDPRGVEELIDTTNVTGWDFLWATLTILGGVLLARVARAAVRQGLSRVTELPPNIVNLITKVVGWALIMLAVVLALPFIGVDTGPVVIIVLLLAAAAVLSGRVLLENLGAGVILQGEASFKPGDQIETNHATGLVLEVSSRAVKIETLDGRMVIVPNISVLSGSVVNLTARSERRSELVVGLKYGTDLDTAREVLAAAAADAAGVLSDPAVEVFVADFADSSIDFNVWFWHASDLLSEHEVTDAVARSIDRACRARGLTIAFPQRTLWWGDQPPAQD